MKVKGAIMFHQYNNVIKIKLTRPAVSALWIGAAEGNCEGKIILGSRTIALDDINCAILQSPAGRPTWVAASNSTRPASSFLRTSTTRFFSFSPSLPLASPTLPYRPS